MAVILALAGAVLVAVGVALASVPAALVVAGLELLAAAYLTRYLEVGG